MSAIMVTLVNERDSKHNVVILSKRPRSVMRTYMLQIDVDEDGGITVHFKQPDKMVEVFPLTNGAEYRELLSRISDITTAGVDDE